MVQTQEAGRALDRVEGPKDRVDRLVVVGVAFQFEQSGLGRGDVVEALDGELAEQVRIGVLWKMRGRRFRVTVW